MAFGVQITVWGGAAETGKGEVLNEMIVPVQATSQVSGVLLPNVGKRNITIRVAADTDCFVTWGDSPVALNDGLDGRAMGPTMSTVEYFNPRSDQFVAVIQRT